MAIGVWAWPKRERVLVEPYWQQAQDSLTSEPEGESQPQRPVTQTPLRASELGPDQWVYQPLSSGQEWPRKRPRKAKITRARPPKGHHRSEGMGRRSHGEPLKPASIKD